MSPLLIYAPRTSNRLVYVLDWLFGEQLQTGYKLTHDAMADVTISYGLPLEHGISIPDAGLLWETGNKPINIQTGRWDDLPVLFATHDAKYSLPFDIFSAIFFLLSRYEEYYSFTPDKHGRYPATESILYKKGLLERPLLDEWVYHLKTILSGKCSLSLALGQFMFQPTYDIDIAWSYKNKGVIRNLGAMGGDVLRGSFSRLAERMSVLSGSTQDPYDSYDWLNELHDKLGLTPLYFILAAQKTSAFDKNIALHNGKMKAFVRALGNKGIIGLHPSYHTGKQPGLLQEEKKSLEAITGKKIGLSRQHYIRFFFPETCRLLMPGGIDDDYSMGYGTHLGFRAGTGRSFLWYDLHSESIQPLRIHPFCFMDTTAHFDMRLNVADAFIRLENMAAILQKTKSQLITVFHNFSLGTEKEWKGWREAYNTFVEKYTTS